MGQALIGRPIEGIWHTAVVVYGKEYFYGGGGIETCPPGTTVLGQPLKIEEVGETEIDSGIFMDYLQTQQRDRFRGDRYDLLRHNCNNFSHETSQFLTGRGIPQHILDLPNEVMSTPLGQMLAPMLEQMNPHGTSIPFTSNNSSSAPTPSTQLPPPTQPSRKLFPVRDYITFDAPIKEEGLIKKLEEFNTLQEDTLRLNESDMKLVLGIAKGLVRLSKDNFSVLMRLRKWESKHVFPLLDILRCKSSKISQEQSEQANQMVELFLSCLQPEHPVNCMLACKGLSNLAFGGHLSLQSLESILTPLSSLLPTSLPSLETAMTSLLSNISVMLVSQPSLQLESAILISSSLVSSLLLDLTQEESVYRGLVSLGNTIFASRTQEEVRQLLLSMDAIDLVSGLSTKGEKAGQAGKEIISLLNNTSNNQDINLD